MEIPQNWYEVALQNNPYKTFKMFTFLTCTNFKISQNQVAQEYSILYFISL